MGNHQRIGIRGHLLLLYLGSTLYHSARRPRIRRIMKIIDHSAIYLLIAGTHIPFALASLSGCTGSY